MVADRLFLLQTRRRYFIKQLAVSVLKESPVGVTALAGVTTSSTPRRKAGPGQGVLNRQNLDPGMM